MPNYTDATTRIAELEGALIAWAKEERKSGQSGFSTAPLLRLMHMSQELLVQAESADARGEEKL